MRVRKKRQLFCRLVSTSISTIITHTTNIIPSQPVRLGLHPLVTKRANPQRVRPLVGVQHLQPVLGIRQRPQHFLQVALAPQLADIHAAAQTAPIVPQLVALGESPLVDRVVVDVLVFDGAVVELDEGVHARLLEEARLPDRRKEPLLLAAAALPEVAHVDEHLPLRFVTHHLLPPLTTALLGHQPEVHLALSHPI